MVTPLLESPPDGTSPSSIGMLLAEELLTLGVAARDGGGAEEISDGPSYVALFISVQGFSSNFVLLVCSDAVFTRIGES